MSTPRKKTGRPSKYDPAKHPEQAFALYSAGKTDAEVAALFKVTVSTLHLWKKEHPEFSDALKRAKDVQDNIVEASLLNRAKGYSHPDVHITAWQGEVIVTPITKHYPPDTTAMIFWLKNRRPKEWRDKVENTTTHEAGDSLVNLLKNIRERKS
jgi:hypothetical protein